MKQLNNKMRRNRRLTLNEAIEAKKKRQAIRENDVQKKNPEKPATLISFNIDKLEKNKEEEKDVSKQTQSNGKLLNLEEVKEFPKNVEPIKSSFTPLNIDEEEGNGDEDQVQQPPPSKKPKNDEYFFI